MHKQVRCYFDLAQDYQIAAATLWTQIIPASYLYNPTRYLLRHTIELLLKGLIVKELRRDNKQLVLKDIMIDNRHMNSTHSLLFLWKHFKQLLSSHNITLNSKDKHFIDKMLAKSDKKDLNSTKYRYPVDKNDKALNLQPIKIQFDGTVPDLANGIPSIVQCGNKVGVMNKGQRSMQDVVDLFDVAELLFQLLE